EADHVTWVKNQAWESAYLKMPDIPTSNELNVTAVDVTAVLKAGDKQIGKAVTMSWSQKTDVWKDQRGPASGPYAFLPMAGVWVGSEDLKEARSHVTTKVTRGARPPALKMSEVNSFTSVVPAVNGTIPVSGPWEGFQSVTLDGQSLSFNKIDPDS